METNRTLMMLLGSAAVLAPDSPEARAEPAEFTTAPRTGADKISMTRRIAPDHESASSLTERLI